MAHRLAAARAGARCWTAAPATSLRAASTASATMAAATTTVTAARRCRPLSATASAAAAVRQFRNIHSTRPAPQESKKARAAAAAAAANEDSAAPAPAPASDASSSAAVEAPAEGAAAAPAADDPPKKNEEKTPYERDLEAANADPSDPCPAYQNPRHHLDPTKRMVFNHEFKDAGLPVPDPVPLPPFDDGGSGKTVASKELHDIADEILSMNMLEVRELMDRIGQHFGLEDEPIVLGGGGAPSSSGGEGTAAAEEEVKEERTAFDIKLVGFDAKSKIKVIKEVRAAAGLGLKEAKEAVEGAPRIVVKDVKKDEAEELKEKLEGAGATVEIV